jgi:hypothetical protein
MRVFTIVDTGTM